MTVLEATRKDGAYAVCGDTLAADSGISKPPSAAKPEYGEMVALAYNPYSRRWASPRNPCSE